MAAFLLFPESDSSLCHTPVAKNPAKDRTVVENVGKPSSWIRTPMHCPHAQGAMPAAGIKINFF